MDGGDLEKEVMLVGVKVLVSGGNGGSGDSRWWW